MNLRLEGAGTIDTFGHEEADAAARSADTSVARWPASTLTYEPYYGLEEKPFSLSTDPRFLYRSTSHVPVLRDLAAAIRRREGLIVLTGDIGTGKTTLCRAVIDQLDHKTFATFVPDPFVTREDLLKTMLIDFGVMSVDDLVKGRLKGASRPDLGFPLYEFLRSLEPLDAFAVLVIDEVQNLSLPLLEEIRILSDLEAGRKLLQVVLVGQPEFDDHLRLPRMRQIHQRVSVHCQLQPLDRDDVTSYVSHRLHTAGATAGQVQLSTEALDLVFEASGGVPRVINLLCDKALARGQQHQTASIGAEFVRQAMADLRMGGSKTSPAPASAARPTAVTAERLARPDRLDGAVDDDGTRAAPASRALPSSARSLARGKVWLGHRRLRPVTAAVLVLLGLTTSVSVVSYWMWVRPAWFSPIELPLVARPAQAQAGVGPLLLGPGTPLGPGGGLVHHSGASGSSRPMAVAVAGEPTWAIQVASFTDLARSASTVARLEALNYPAFERDVDLGDQGRVRVVLAGPYGSRGAAAAALEALRRIPGFEGALAKPLTPVSRIVDPVIPSRR